MTREGDEPAILIVDDEGYIIEVLERALQREGYVTTSVQDGQEAMALLTTSEFDLILCDFELPGMNGIEFYKKLSESRQATMERFVFMTGNMLDPSKQAFLSEHGIPILMKPFDLNELYQEIGKALSRQ